jgi:Trp operon repressor
MEIFVPLVIIATISIIANIFMLWYIRNLLSKVLFVSDNLGDLVSMISIYSEHLKGVYSLEMYHGDETIQFLMSHTTSLIEMLEEYEDIYSIAEPIEIYEDLEEGEEQQREVTEFDGENVFYAGSRRRDT